MNPHPITQLLTQAAQGAPQASEDLLPLVYDDLRALAASKLAREQPGQTLQATALVHEAYLRLVAPEGQPNPSWQGRRHFFGAAAEAMRRILIENARRKQSRRRGGGLQRVAWTRLLWRPKPTTTSCSPSTRLWESWRSGIRRRRSWLS